MSDKDAVEVLREWRFKNETLITPVTLALESVLDELEQLRAARPKCQGCGVYVPIRYPAFCTEDCATETGVADGFEHVVQEQTK